MGSKGIASAPTNALLSNLINHFMSRYFSFLRIRSCLVIVLITEVVLNMYEVLLLGSDKVGRRD